MNRRQFLFGALLMVTWVKGEIATADKLNSTFAEEVGKVASISALRDLRIPQDGDSQTVILDGYASANDGGGGVFIWSASANNADDGATIITPNTKPATGRWIRLFAGAVNPLWFGAKGDGVTNDTTPVQNALNSGAVAVWGGGKSYLVTTLTVPANIMFDGQGGSLLTNGATNQSVLNTGGDNATIQNWNIRSNVTGTRKGMYGVNINNNYVILRHLNFQDISYSAVFNNGTGTRGHDLCATNCGWDAISNYTNALDGYFTKIKGVGNGRSLVSTDVGATRIYLDGFECIDNGLDAISDQHKDVLHFEGANDCTFRNGKIIYTSGYSQGTISQTFAIMRWNNSTNCWIKNVDIHTASSANNRLELGLVDSVNSAHNSNCGTQNINVDSSAIASYQLIFWNYDTTAGFKVLGGRWNGYTSIRGGAAGFGFSTIRGLTADGEGSGQFLISDYITSQCDFLNLTINGYGLPFNLSGFRQSSIKGCVIDGAASCVFQLLNTNTATSYQPDGGVISGNTIRALSNPVGTILNTNNQQTSALLFANNTIDCSPSVGLNTTGGTAGATTANIKAIGNIVNGTITTVTTGGINSSGTLNANMNNVAT